MILWGYVFEDGLTRDWDGEKLFETHLKPRGWKEGPRNSAYRRAVRSSVMSLYEVSDIKPGQSLVARDLLRESEPVLVHEGAATQMVRQWDRLAARILPSDGRHVFAGGLLTCSAETCDHLSWACTRHCKENAARRRFSSSTSTNCGRSPRSSPLVGWPAPWNEWPPRPCPQPCSTVTGMRSSLHDIRFPVAKGVTRNTVAARLDTIAGRHCRPDRGRGGRRVVF